MSLSSSHHVVVVVADNLKRRQGRCEIEKKTSSESSIKKIKRVRTKSDKLKELKEDAIENKTKFEKWIEIKTNRNQETRDNIKRKIT